MKQKELLGNIEHVIRQQCHDDDIKQIVYDSRKATPDSLFVCVPGEKVDGHDYAKEAITNGAKTLVVEKTVELYSGINIIKVNSARQAMAQIASKFYGNPSAKLNVIGVTGTNGKTTITYLLRNIFEASQQKTGVIGTINNWVGNEKITTERTTPEAPDFQQLLKTMLAEGVKTCLMEVSSHSLSLNRVDATSFQVGLFTNLTEDHLDFHPDMEHYYKAKKKLFAMTRKANVINADDPFGARMIKELESNEMTTISYGITEGGNLDLRAMDITMDFKGVHFIAKGLGMNHSISLPIPGKFSIYNALAAIAASRVMDIPQNNIVNALEKTKGIPGRFQRIDEFKDFGVIIDYAHTKDALENVLKSIRQFAGGRIITVFGCGGDRDTGKRSKMGKASGELSDYSILTSDNPRSEDPNNILQMIESGVKSTGGKYAIIENRKEAIRKAILMADKNDIILIAGKGHETTQTIGDKTDHFDDYEVALDVAREEKII
ncbi:MAG: UDP-N-acetylmuramoyl-L-alanyl-D-glutamate--2,6-diaminopimelate ligase [Tindallia sp. MSAO_Bac2]|nr:MAG: UDP-N-acetylmuramoyl-L-alanyl-D-glutamate--2,6-diaminopimelate ligase [Tindallia sp. MSAO_Bac2]